MTTASTVDRTRHLVLQSKQTVASSLELCRTARTTRTTVAEMVRKSPFRRGARLARGASEGLLETPERRCPHCRIETAIKAGGSMQVADGLMKSAYRCDSCRRSFLYVTGLQLSIPASRDGDEDGRPGAHRSLREWLMESHVMGSFLSISALLIGVALVWLFAVVWIIDRLW